MPIEKGAFGKVLVGADVVGEMTAYEFDEQADIEETTVAGTDEVRHSATVFRSNGSVDCYLDDSDVGQAAIGAGASVTLQMRPGGDGTGKPQRQVSAVISSVREPLNATEYNKVTFSWLAGKVDRTAQA